MDFCKCWNSKFESKGNSVAFIDGVLDHEHIANNFFSQFAIVCSLFNVKRNEELWSIFIESMRNYDGSPIIDTEHFTVEPIADLISKMSSGNAAGLDDAYLYSLTYVSTITAIYTSASGRETTRSEVETSQRNKTRLHQLHHYSENTTSLQRDIIRQHNKFLFEQLSLVIQ
jgi:hypothetical protein